MPMLMNILRGLIFGVIAFFVVGISTGFIFYVFGCEPEVNGAVTVASGGWAAIHVLTSELLRTKPPS